MKIVSTGDTIVTPEFHEKKKKAKRKKLIWWLLGIISILVLIVIISRREALQIKTVSVNGARVVSADEVSEEAKQLLRGYYLGLIPKTNSLVYPQEKVREGLRKKFPRLTMLALTLEDINVLRVDVSEREPFALYCGDAIKVKESSKCYFLDKTGYIFDEAPLFSGAVYFVYGLEKPLEDPLRHELLSPPDFEKLSQFISELPELGLKPVAVVVSEDELNLFLATENNIVWKKETNLNTIYANLDAFLNNYEIKKEKDFLERVNVLDLRTDNKVFYRFK